MARRFGIPLVLSAAAVLATAAALAPVGGDASAQAPTKLDYVIRRTAIEYVTSTGTSSTFPGRLATGDRIFAQDTLLRGGRAIGFDNTLCTVTFGGNDLCHAIAVFRGKGAVEATWLWLGRNLTQNGPAHFDGVIDGGTGAYADATGQFTGSPLHNGDLRIDAHIG